MVAATSQSVLKQLPMTSKYEILKVLDLLAKYATTPGDVIIRLSQEPMINAEATVSNHHNTKLIIQCLDNNVAMNWAMSAMVQVCANEVTTPTA